jgi:hypothetical protein
MAANHTVFLYCRILVPDNGRGGKVERHDDNLSRRLHALYHELAMPRARSSRPLVERLPHIAIRDLVAVIPRRNPHEVYCLDSFGLRYREKVLVSTHAIKVGHQQFRVRWIKTGFGRHRPLLICTCGRSTYYLYDWHGQYACKHCHRAHYLCQRISKTRNKLWQAARLRLELNGLPNDYKLPARPRGRDRKTYLRLRDRIGSLELKARKAQKREFDTRLFAYHL